MYPFSDNVKIIEASKNPQTQIDLQQWIWPKADEECWQIIKSNWEGYHDRLWLKYCKKRNVVVQAGGCAGLYPRLLSNYFGIVYTFEPEPLNFFCLTYNCQQQNVIKMQCALGDKPGSIIITTHPINCGMHHTTPHEHCRIPQITLDSLELRDLDLLALDIEGTELNALLGSYNTIMKFRPTIIVEAGHEEQRSGIKEWLGSINYKFAERSAWDDIFIPEERDNV